MLMSSTTSTSIQKQDDGFDDDEETQKRTSVGISRAHLIEKTKKKLAITFFHWPTDKLTFFLFG